MPEFTQSWVFAFLLGCIIGGCFGVVLAAILAASGRASRMEEKISDSAIHEVAKREEQRRGEKMKFAPNLICKSCGYWKGICIFDGPCPHNPLNNESEQIVTKNNPRTD